MPKFVAIWKDAEGNTYETSPKPTSKGAREQAKLILKNYQVPKPKKGTKIRIEQR